MKALSPTLVLLVSLCFASGAGSETIIKNKAKQLRNENNARQGVPPPQTPPPQAPAARVGPVQPDPTRQSLGRFGAGLGAIRQNVPVTEEQKQKLVKDLTASAGGVKKPKTETIQELVNNLSFALMEKPLPPAQRSRLMQDLDGLLNPAKYPQAKPDAIATDIQSIFLANGLARNRATEIGNLAKTLSAEVR